MTLAIDIVYPHLPPEVDGIGDHSVILASELQEQGHRVRLLGRVTREQAERLHAATGAAVVDAWGDRDLRDTRALEREAVSGGADVVLLQFEQFAYGERGFNPAVSRLFGVLRQRRPTALRVLYAHENYTYPDTASHAVMWLYQRRQFLRLTRDADRVLVSTDAWSRRDHLRDAVVLPVFSNMPLTEGGQRAAVDDPSSFVWFGHLDASRSPYFRAALRLLDAYSGTAGLTYLGLDGGRARELAREAGFDRLHVVDAPPREEVSRYLARARFALAPFADGASARRGTVMAALQHGCCVVTNTGSSTDAAIDDLVSEGAVLAADSASVEAFEAALTVALASSPDRLERISSRAAAVYAERFAPSVAARTLTSMLTGS